MGGAQFVQFGQLDKPHANESAKRSLEPNTIKKVALVRQSLLLASGSYTIPFLIVSRTIFVEKEPRRQSSWQVNNTTSPERNLFSKVHIIHILKSQQEIVCHLTLDI